MTRVPGCDDDVPVPASTIAALPARADGNLTWLPGLADNDTGAAAVEYAAHGWPVFELDGKVPLANSAGFKTATADPAKAAERWKRRPTANIGWAIPDGLWVLDVDPRHGGTDSLRELERKHAPLPFLTLRQRTGSGGLHIVFRAPAGLLLRQGAGFAPGLDTRVAGRGYIVLAPSVHPVSGERYRWQVAVEPALPPDWLVDLVRVREPERAPVQHVRRSQPSTRRQRYGQVVLDALAKEVAEAPEGQRNDTLNRAWFRMGQLHDAVPQSEARSVLTNAARVCGLNETEIARVLR